MSGSIETMAREQDDEVLVRVTSERLIDKLGKAPDVVAATVREELERHRGSARIQTFVPIFAERAARQRLAR